MNITYAPPLRLKALDINTAEGRFSGYASTFGNEDKNGDIVDAGAFTQTLQAARQKKAANTSPALWPLLWMHSPDQPIGVITDATQDAKGLRISGQVDLNTDAGRRAFSGMSAGYANAFSIGYNVTKATRDKKGVRHLLDIDLCEISLITANFPANEEATVDPLSLKSVSGRLPLGPIHNPIEARASREPDMPQPNEYASDRLYREAFTTWLMKRNSVGLPTEAEQNAADFKQAVALDTARRLQSGTATLSERLAAYDKTGRTPDGRRLDDVTDTVNRAYAAVYARLSEQE